MELLVNETAARVMGMEDPVDQPLGLWERDGQIVGVVKDFHMASLYNPIQPVVIRHAWQPAGWVYVRVRGDRVEEALAAFEKTHRAFDPAFPVDFRFLDAEYEETYRSEVVVGTLMTCFAGLACFVAFLGLFGLVSFTVSQRTREIAIRKVLGASAGRIALLVSRDVLVLAGVAFGLSVPLAFFVMREWLSRFAYHIDLGPGVFVVAALSLTGLVLLTVGSQSVLAALVNPAESLRRNG